MTIEIHTPELEERLNRGIQNVKLQDCGRCGEWHVGATALPKLS